MQKDENRLYKFRDLKFYTSTEWLAENKKKYRQVYDRYQTGYIYAELSFFNKAFDKEDWELSVELKCYAKTFEGEDKLLCKLPITKRVSPLDSIVYIREGWGNDKLGSFWKKGVYYWEAWIGDQKIATEQFFIEEADSQVYFDENPYIKLLGAKLYEGPFDDVSIANRTYLRVFDHEKTRLVFAEINLKNLRPAEEWHCELIVKFYNNAKELKGQVVRLQKILKDEDAVIVSMGLGTNDVGLWRTGLYSAEIIFMDHVLAVIPFEIDDEHIEGENGVIFPYKQMGEFLPNTEVKEEEDTRTFDEVMEDMDKLIGLTRLKQQVRNHANYIRFLQLRKEKGFEEKDKINVHSVFSGNPGTGKTTVAVMMGQLYKKMGLLSKGHVKTADRVDLVGEYIGQTAPKVKDVIEKARGGVLFIDEAYSLSRSNADKKDFGREAIEILIKEMSDGKGDLAVIVAGYPKEMKDFLESNPGLRSRFKLFFDFPDYLPQELSQIAEYACQQKEVVLTPAAKTYIDEHIINAFRDRGSSFGNARYVFDLIEKAKIEMGLRIMSGDAPEELENELLATIQADDVRKIANKDKKELPNIPVDEKLLDEALAELNSLIGMPKIKDQINEMVRLVRFYRETGKDVLNKFFLHTVLIGNPGTGKTTVARILVKIYKALGVLERGHMVETDRQGLVAGFVGQTAIKTAKKIDEAIGGVLFVDEAYALTQGGHDSSGSFGDEAVQTLLKRMEDLRGQFFLFVAGYPDNMEAFLKANPGLNSRFDQALRFDDYSPSELLEIALLMLKEEQMQLTDEANEYLKNYMEYIHNYRDKYFGNARTIRLSMHEVIKAHNLRLAAINKKDRKKAGNNILTIEDVSVLKTDKSDFIFNKKSIGFQRQTNN